MTRKLIFSASMLVVVVLLGVAILRYAPPRSGDICQICNRPIHSGMGYRLELADRSETACCPRCGMHFDLTQPGRVVRAFAKDFYSGTEIPAGKAQYIEGGNEVYCAHIQPLERKEPQSTAQLAFDRCAPPLVAFATLEGARKYQAEHGGRLLSYQEALESVRQK